MSDHKLITKTNANRMSKAVINVINERQTAYIKGQLSNDNIRSLIATIDLTNEDPNLEGLLISLDAKKPLIL